MVTKVNIPQHWVKGVEVQNLAAVTGYTVQSVSNMRASPSGFAPLICRLTLTENLTQQQKNTLKGDLEAELNTITFL